MEEFDVKAAAEFLGVSVGSVRKYVTDGTLKPLQKQTKFGPQNVFTREQLEAFKAARESTVYLPAKPDSKDKALAKRPNALPAAERPQERLTAIPTVFHLTDKHTYSIPEAALVSGFPSSVLREAVKASQLKGRKVGRGIRVHREDLARFVREFMTAGNEG